MPMALRTCALSLCRPCRSCARRPTAPQCACTRITCLTRLALGLCSVLRRYGVGQIHFRQEKYEMAEYHFRRSLQVHFLFVALGGVFLLTGLHRGQHAGEGSAVIYAMRGRSILSLKASRITCDVACAQLQQGMQCMCSVPQAVE